MPAVRPLHGATETAVSGVWQDWMVGCLGIVPPCPAACEQWFLDSCMADAGTPPPPQAQLPSAGSRSSAPPVVRVWAVAAAAAAMCRSPSRIRVREEIMWPQKCRIVWKYQRAGGWAGAGSGGPERAVTFAQCLEEGVFPPLFPSCPRPP